MTEVHAVWSRHGSTFCGEKGNTVIIRHPDDWNLVSCDTCRYAAMRNE